MNKMWGIYYKAPARKRKCKKPPPTRQEVENAVWEYLAGGGRITRIETCENPGELARFENAQEFTAGFSLTDLTDIF